MVMYVRTYVRIYENATVRMYILYNAHFCHKTFSFHSSKQTHSHSVIRTYITSTFVQKLFFHSISIVPKALT